MIAGIQRRHTRVGLFSALQADSLRTEALEKTLEELMELLHSQVDEVDYVLGELASHCQGVKAEVALRTVLEDEQAPIIIRCERSWAKDNHQDSHYVVVVGVRTDGRVLIHDPCGGASQKSQSGVQEEDECRQANSSLCPGMPAPEAKMIVNKQGAALVAVPWEQFEGCWQAGNQELQGRKWLQVILRPIQIMDNTSDHGVVDWL